MRFPRLQLFGLVTISGMLGLVIGLGVSYWSSATFVSSSENSTKSIAVGHESPQASVCKVVPKKDFLFHPKLDPVPPNGLGSSDVDNLSDADLADLTDYRPLFVLYLGVQDKLSDISLKYVAQLLELEGFSLCCDQITDKGLASLSKLERLKKLELNSCKQLKGTSIQSLSNIRSLEYLEIRNGGLRELHVKEGFCFLNTINIGGDHLESVRLNGLLQLEKLKLSTRSHLKSLDLCCCLGLSSLDVFSDAPFRPENFRLTGLPFLQNVVLDLPLADEDVEQLAPMADSLETLILPDPLNTISEKTMRQIQNMHNLKVLHLYGKITDEDLQYLRGMPRLQKLSLKGLRINGSGLQWLTELDELLVLSLESTDIQIENLEKWLPKMPYLRRINLNNTRISEAEKTRLFENLPWLREVRNDTWQDPQLPGDEVMKPLL